MSFLSHASPLSIALIIILSCCQFSVADDGWIELFNGKDLNNWKIAEHPDAFKVVDGKMIVKGPRAHAYYAGDGSADAANFENFHLQAQVMTKPSANSGIYFHTKYLEEGWPNRGYEAQVNNTHGDPKKTGGLYDVQDNFKGVAKDNEWFDYEIIVLDKYIIVKINGETVSDYREPDDLVRPTRQLSSGTFAIQAHDPKSEIWYKDIKVKPLP